jgi:hypothetical protein
MKKYKIWELVTMKKWALFTLLSAALLLPSNALANNEPTKTSGVSSTETEQQAMATQTFRFAVAAGEYDETGYIYVNTPGYVNVTVNQQSSSAREAKVYYRLAKLEPDGYQTRMGSGTFTGNGTFSFSSENVCPVGTYLITIDGRQGKVSGTITVNTP